MNAKKSGSKARRSKSLEGLKYAEAMAELERILEELEGDEIDVDELSTRVSRASELIGLCRSRLLHSKAEIEEVVAGLEALESSSEAGEVDRDEDEDDPS
jgi:exodeoxyribonuclease VII small subunit